MKYSNHIACFAKTDSTAKNTKIKRSLYKTKIALISEEDRGEVKTTLYHPNSAAEAALCGLQQDLTYNGVCRHSL
mgnify:CR=1 FL=1